MSLTFFTQPASPLEAYSIGLRLGKVGELPAQAMSTCPNLAQPCRSSTSHKPPAWLLMLKIVDQVQEMHAYYFCPFEAGIKLHSLLNVYDVQKQTR